MGDSEAEDAEDAESEVGASDVSGLVSRGDMRYTHDGPVDNGPGGGHVPQLVMLQVSIFPLFLLCIARASTASLADLLAKLAEAWGWAVC